MVILDLRTFRQNHDGGSVTGVIFLELENRAFPAIGWSDFPVIILSWWIEALLQLEIPLRRKVQWQFMDGPYCLTLTKAEGNPSIGSFEFLQVQNSLLEAAERVVAHCEQFKMLSKDLDLLRDNVRRLKSHQAVLQTDASLFVHI